MKHVLIIATGLTIGCAADVEQTDTSRAPLVGGIVDSEDPGVVSLTANNRSFCTGTLVSPSVVLTAAHCIDMIAGNPGINLFFGTDINSVGTKVGVRKVVTHPGWTGNLGGVAHDIGMALIDFPQDPELAIPMNTLPMSQFIGSKVKKVGFGINDDVNQTADGKKRIGYSEIYDVSLTSDTYLYADDVVQVCFGDSGGPGFLTIEGVEYLVGITSFLQGSCTPGSGSGGDTRVNLYAEDFVLPWIQENDPACRQDDLCARIGCTDDPDCQPCGPDGTCASDCEIPDIDCATQDIGELCRANSQCMGDLCVYWRDDPSTDFCSKPCVSDSECPSGMSCQNVSPFGDICYYDGDPPGVVGSACTSKTDCGSLICDQGACVTECDLPAGLICPQNFACESTNAVDYYCRRIPGESGGCTASASAGSATSHRPWAVLALLALVGLIRRRRRLARTRKLRH